MRCVKFVRFFLFLFLPIVLLATFVVLATGVLSYKVYVVHTGSMSPTIPPGSAVIVHEGHYKLGQVITFTEHGLTVTHRLVSINAQGLTTTKGDANSTPDPWHVPKKQIIGGVVAAPRYVGYWITYLKNPLGLGSIVLGILAVSQIWWFSGKDPTAPDAGETNDSRRARKEKKRRRGALPETSSSPGSSETQIVEVSKSSDVLAMPIQGVSTNAAAVDKKKRSGSEGSGRDVHPDASKKSKRKSELKPLAQGQFEPADVALADHQLPMDPHGAPVSVHPRRRRWFKRNHVDHTVIGAEIATSIDGVAQAEKSLEPEGRDVHALAKGVKSSKKKGVSPAKKAKPKSEPKPKAEKRLKPEQMPKLDEKPKVEDKPRLEPKPAVSPPIKKEKTSSRKKSDVTSTGKERKKPDARPASQPTDTSTAQLDNDLAKIADAKRRERVTKLFGVARQNGDNPLQGKPR